VISLYLRHHNIMSAPLPAHWRLHLAETLSEYTLSLFREKLAATHDGDGQPPSPPVLPPSSVPLLVAAECEHAAEVLIQAFTNPGQSPLPHV